jgi:hypothetical protein
MVMVGSGLRDQNQGGLIINKIARWRIAVDFLEENHS